ncbi:MAG: hypothetical protein LBE25_05405 [Arthrobacter sp.]|jgi:hypothetical protein|nr:hypothetical protein [Arthrobacter sp.]
MSTPELEQRNEPPLRVLRRHWVAAAIAFVAIWLAVSALALALPVTFSVSATVQVYPVAGGQSANPTNVAPVNISTEARVASSDPVLSAAATSLGGIDVATLRGSIEVEAPDGSQNLLVAGTAGSAEEATARANAVARAYLEVRGEMASALVDAADANLAGLITSWSKDPALRSRVAELELSRAELGQVNTVPGVLIDPAVAGRATATGRAIWGIAAGGVLGLLGAVAVVLWRERTSRLASDAGRVAAKTGRRVLDWDGDAEGVRRVLLGLGDGRSFAVTGDVVASQRFAAALAAALRERGDVVTEASVDRADEVDAGRTERALLRASAGATLVATADPALGFSRFVRLSRRSRVVLVVSRRSRIEALRSALADLAGRDGVCVVFARASLARASRPEPGYRNAADRALAFELAANEANEVHGSQGTAEPEAVEPPAHASQGAPGAEAVEPAAHGAPAGEGTGTAATQRQGKRAARPIAEPERPEPEPQHADATSDAERRLVVALSLSGPAGSAAPGDTEPEGVSREERHGHAQPSAEARESVRGGEER